MYMTCFDKVTCVTALHGLLEQYLAEGRNWMAVSMRPKRASYAALPSCFRALSLTDVVFFSPCRHLSCLSAFGLDRGGPLWHCPRGSFFPQRPHKRHCRSASPASRPSAHLHCICAGQRSPEQLAQGPARDACRCPAAHSREHCDGGVAPPPRLALARHAGSAQTDTDGCAAGVGPFLVTDITSHHCCCPCAGHLGRRHAQKGL